MKSLMPFKVTAALTLFALALVAYIHKALDAVTFVSMITPVFTFLTGVLTHSEIPDDEWQRMKQEKKNQPPS